MATEVIRRIEPWQLASAAISARITVEEQARAADLHRQMETRIRVREEIERGLAALFGWSPNEVEWEEWSDPYRYATGPEPMARSGRFTFRRDPDHSWGLLVSTKRDRCEHEVAVGIAPSSPTDADNALLIIGHLLERAEGEDCQECRYGAAEKTPVREPYRPPPSATERLAQAIRDLVREEA